jgi:hypothetical protein
MDTLICSENNNIRMTSEVICKGCGKSIQKDIFFCPYCGTSLGRLEEEYIFTTMDDYSSVSTDNLKRFLGFMDNPEELEERIQKDEPDIFEKQRKVTEEILRRFPEVRRYVFENPELRFKAFIISTPYFRKGNILQHDCLLRRLAIRQNGLINFSLGSAQLATDLYAFDNPIWADKRVGHKLLFNQKQLIENCLPASQKEFLICAEPWWACSKVFDLDGRWVNWKLLFKTEKFSDYVQKEKEVPLNFHIFSSMEYSHLFSIAGTSGDGEVLVGIYNEEESEIFKNQVHELGKLYEFGKKPEIQTIRISWDTLESLGIIGISAIGLLQSQSHFFRKTMSERIIEGTKQKTALDTRGTMTGGKSTSIDKFLERLEKRFLLHEVSGQQEGVMKITHGIPRELRKKYRVLGDKA